MSLSFLTYDIRCFVLLFQFYNDDRQHSRSKSQPGDDPSNISDERASHIELHQNNSSTSLPGMQETGNVTDHMNMNIP